MSNFPPPPPPPPPPSSNNTPGLAGFGPSGGEAYLPPGAYPPMGLGYAQPGAVRAGSKPPALMGLAIVGIIVGALFLLCHAVMYFTYVTPSPLMGKLQAYSAGVNFMVVFAVSSWVLSVVQIVASIGALSLQPWARRFLLIYAVLQLPLGITGAIVDLYLANVMLAGVRIPEATYTGLLIGASIRYGILIAMPIWTLSLMTRPHIRQLFEPRP